MTVISNRPPNLRSNLVANLVGEDALANEKLASQFYNSHSGVNNLPRYITINSVTKDADFIYHGGDASASGLNPQVGGATGNLTLQAGAVPTYNQGSPYHGGPNDDSVLGNAGGYFLAGNNTFGNLSTNDGVWRLIFKATGTTTVIAAKRNAGVGWEIGIDAADKLYLTIEDSGAAVTTISAALDIGSWYDAKIFADRSGSCQIDINGATSGAAVLISGSALTLDSATALAVLADSAGAGLFDSNVAYFGMWSGAAWLDSHLQATLVAREYQQLTRTMPDFAKGTRAPTVATRAFSAYSEKLENGRTETAMYLMGDNQIRVNSKMSKSGEYFEGVHLEPQATNNLTYSEHYTQASSNWTNGEITIHATKIAAPNKEITMEGIVASSVAGAHYILQNATHTAGNNVISCFLKKGNQDWVRLSVGGIGASCYFDLNTGAVGTAVSAVGKIKDMGDHYRAQISYTGDGAVHPCYIYSAENNNDVSFTGDDATVTTYLWGAQHETTGLGYATSYIPTVLAAATRLKDDLQYAGGANIGGKDIGQGTFVADVLFDDFDLGSTSVILSISDGGAAADSITNYISSGDVFGCITAATAGNAGASVAVGDIVDGEIHTLRTRYKTDNLIVANNGVDDATPDTSCDMPDDVDTIHMGMSRANTQQAACLMRNIRIYSDPDVEL